MVGLGMQELIIIFVIIMVLFGAKKLPELGKGIGQAIRDFNKAISGKEEIEHAQGKPAEEEKKSGGRDGDMVVRERSESCVT